MKQDLKIERRLGPPSKNTFSIKAIKEFLQEEMTEGLWIDPFANTARLASITNDLNPKFDTDYNMDSVDFLKLFDDESVDGVLFDPPFSPRQVKECYEGFGRKCTQRDTSNAFYFDCFKEIKRIVKPGGKVICFGWNSNGVPTSYGFKLNRVLLVCHGSHHNDTICTVSEKNKEQQLDFGL